MGRWERIGWRVVVALAAASLMSLRVTAAAEAPKAPEPTVTTLEHLEPSALFLKAQEGLKGDFTIAREAPAVDFAIFPGQWETKDLWSSWGDALYASNGKFYAVIGDHAMWGTTYVHELDPNAKTLRLVIDVDKALGLTPEDYAAGKVHAPIIDRGDGWLYFVNYPGVAPVLLSYKGDWFFRYEMASGKVERLGVLVPGCGVATLQYHAPSDTLYGLAEGFGLKVAPLNKFFAYDLEKRELVYYGGPEIGGMTRALMVAADGRAYYAGKDKMLQRYDPKEKTVTPINQQIPGDGSLRAVSRPAADGVIYAFSADGVVFAFDPKTETILWSARAFTESSHYITACRLDPTDRYLYYVPDAHGSAWQCGAPVIQFDLKTRKPKVLASLNEFFAKEKGYNLGGTYGIALNPEGTQLFISWNGSPVGDKQQGFGQCSAMIVHIPESERRAAP